MKRIFTELFSVFVIALSLIAPVQAYETYTLDPMHTYVLWHVNHFGFSNPSGKWMAEGTLTLDEANPQNSKVVASIPLASIVTGIPKLDEHLKSNTFFNVSQYPIAKFVSNKAIATGKNTGKLYGTLTLHGVSKPVILEVMFNKAGLSPITNKKTVGFTASAQLKRSDFGINAYLPGIGDDVKINIEAEGYKAE